ncbi:MAG: cation:proton antiporter [Chthoniobacterales bacterium]|nr:cation:proton antiporter [Chthoniobacterales bacterium]
MPLAVAEVSPMFSLLALMLVGVVAVSLLLLRLQQSLLVAYFLCGIAIANTGLLDVVAGEGAKETISTMSDYGVMLLLFVLGMEFSLGELRHLRRYAFTGGALQMSLTMLAAGAATWWFFDFSWAQTVVVAVACALSSTAISVKLYQDMGVAASSGARLALGVAIFQDIFVICFLVVLPALMATGAGGGTIGPALVGVVAKGAAFLGISVLLARFVIPRLLHTVALTKSRELFTLTVAGLCMGVALLAALMGLSVVLGAFVAGLAVSECMYKHRILSDVAPIKDLFLTIFFVSVGLGIEIAPLAKDWALVLSVVAALILGKSVLVALLARFLGLSWRAATAAGIGLGSAGEFSLVLMVKTADMTVWPGNMNQPLLAAMALSMALIPVLIRFARPLGQWLEVRYPDVLRLRRRIENQPRGSVDLSDHAIVCGYGPVGQALVQALSSQGVMSLVIDLNAATIHELQSKGQPALFADAAQREVWSLCGVDRARLVAFTFPATPAVETALGYVREKNPAIAVMARTKFRREAKRLAEIGADIVVLDEEESGRALIKRALGVLHLDHSAEPVGL